MAIGTSILHITSKPPEIEGHDGLKICAVEGKHTFILNEIHKNDIPKVMNRSITNVRPPVPSHSVI